MEIHLKRPVPPIGARFHSWTVIGPKIETDTDPRIRCRCDCGEIREVMFYELLRGRTFRCIRCTRRLMNPKFKHGHARAKAWTKEFRCWLLMRQRCTDKNCRHYHNYGGRGIRVCARWAASFSNFLHDVGPAPSPQHSIDRINGNGHYEPTNVRWATRLQQANNRRNNHRITWRGTTQSIAEWARFFKVKRLKLYKRLLRRNWNPELVFPSIRSDVDIENCGH